MIPRHAVSHGSSLILGSLSSTPPATATLPLARYLGGTLRLSTSRSEAMMVGSFYETEMGLECARPDASAGWWEASKTPRALESSYWFDPDV
jgi:hypothetical protein